MTGPTLFPHSDHDHHACESGAIARAEAICALKGQRLTPLRRQVLDVLLASHHPLGAYEIIDALARQNRRPAPMSVYRVLDFLREVGLVHRIESRNAFLACVHGHGDHATTVFFICDRCGNAGEAVLPGVSRSLEANARNAGFTPRAAVVEVSGTCADCARPAK